MKYYRILNPADLNPEEEDDSVFLGWKEIINPCLEFLIEENIDFLYYLLINLPFVEEDGKITAKEDYTDVLHGECELELNDFMNIFSQSQMILKFVTTYDKTMGI